MDRGQEYQLNGTFLVQRLSLLPSCPGVWAQSPARALRSPGPHGAAKNFFKKAKSMNMEGNPASRRLGLVGGLGV